MNQVRPDCLKSRLQAGRIFPSRVKSGSTFRSPGEAAPFGEQRFHVVPFRRIASTLAVIQSEARAVGSGFPGAFATDLS